MNLSITVLVGVLAVFATPAVGQVEEARPGYEQVASRPCHPGGVSIPVFILAGMNDYGQVQTEDDE